MQRVCLDGGFWELRQASQNSSNNGRVHYVWLKVVTIGTWWGWWTKAPPKEKNSTTVVYNLAIIMTDDRATTPNTHALKYVYALY